MMAMPTKEVEIAVIGGGLVGAALTHGLLSAGRKVALFDEGDTAFRASRGNFGLVCAGGKGDKLTAYAPWALQGVEVWTEFGAKLSADTGVDLELEQNGGMVFCLEEEDLTARIETMEHLRQHSGLGYEVMRPAEIAKYMPGVSSDFAGGVLVEIDGAANPLKLLRALHASISKSEGVLRRDARVLRIEPQSHGHRIVTAAGSVYCEKVVLAAGLGNVPLAECFGVKLPIIPMRGQILVTERHEPMLKVPCEQVRQLKNGTFLLGGSWEDVGFDTSTTYDVTQDIAARSVRFMPFLKNVRLVRSWSALRILAPDNAPIYDEIAAGAYLVTCHSGVSLAAIHSGKVAKWIADGVLPAEAAPFHLGRFSSSSQQPKAAHG